MVLLTGAAAMAFTLLAPGAAHANSRRHVFKSEPTSGDTVVRDVEVGGAPEIDGSALGLGLALLAGGVAALAGRRRSART